MGVVHPTLDCNRFRVWAFCGVVLALCGSACAADAPRIEPASSAPPAPVTATEPAPPAPRAQPRSPAGGAARRSPDEMLSAIRERLSAPRAAALAPLPSAPGVRRMEIGAHLQHAVIATVREDGSVHTTCVDDEASAARALGATARAVGAP